MKNIKKSRCYYLATAFFMPAGILLMGTLLLALWSCDSSQSGYQWQGQTMGTYYRLTLVDPATELYSKEVLQQDVESILHRLNAMMSTYIPSSEISHFNQLEVGACIDVSAEFFAVTQQAVEVHAWSDAAFNPLVGALVNRWGFGSSSQGFVLPSEEEIANLLKQVRIENIFLDSNKQALCKTAQTKLDLSAIAKGYAVDQIAQWLSDKGFKNYLVDIGGEIKVSGINQQGLRWRVAIEKPEAMLNSVYEVIAMSDFSVATSGDYRNFFEHEGRRYSHTIDPENGLPVTHGLASVTVIHPSAMLADAWATALNVAGLKKTQLLAEKFSLAVYLIQRDNMTDQGVAEYTAWYSKAFSPHLLKQ